MSIYYCVCECVCVRARVRVCVCVHVCVLFHCVTVIYADIVRGCVRETLDASATACTIKSHISILHKIHRIDCRRSQLKGFSEIIDMPQFYCPCMHRPTAYPRIPSLSPHRHIWLHTGLHIYNSKYTCGLHAVINLQQIVFYKYNPAS